MKYLILLLITSLVLADTVKVKVEGMTCESCVSRIKSKFENIEGVTSTEVSLKEKLVTLEADPNVNDETVRSTITSAGYKVTEISRN